MYKLLFNELTVLPVQLKPSPVYPVLHVHVKLSGILMQAAN